VCSHGRIGPISLVRDGTLERSRVGRAGGCGTCASHSHETSPVAIEPAFGALTGSAQENEATSGLGHRGGGDGVELTRDSFQHDDVSFAGGHALRIASCDRRVKAVVAQVSAIGLWRYLRRSAPAVREAFLVQALADRLDYASTGRPRSVAITGPDEAESILGAAGYDWHRGNEQRHRSFHNAIAAHSLDRIAVYDPAAFVEDISPTPLQVILAEHDTTTPSDVARAVFDRPGEPKELMELGGGHYDVYDNETVKQQCIATTTAFLVTHLLGECSNARAAVV